MTIPSRRDRSVSAHPLAIVDRIIADVELTREQYNDAKSRYEAVAECLNKAGGSLKLFLPKIFPQGSMRLGTTVRPYGKDKFDLDMICWLSASGKVATPEQIYEWVWNALGADEVYRRIRKRKNRCIRLEFPEAKKFYLDVTPAVPDWVLHKESLFVPDRELKQWCSSHPIGYADDWFKPATEILPKFRQFMIANAREGGVRASIEEMPEYGAFDKKPLQRIVQLLKHKRDEHFQKDQEYRPTSILLTTITTHSYLDCVRVPHDGMFEFVIKVIEKLPNFIKVGGTRANATYEVLNPVNSGENFAEKWTEEHYVRFRRWHSRLVEGFQSVIGTRGEGIDRMLNELAGTFGKESVVTAADALGADTDALHQNGKLKISRGIGAAVAAGVAVPRTTFFGK